MEHRGRHNTAKVYDTNMIRVVICITLSEAIGVEDSERGLTGHKESIRENSAFLSVEK